MSDGQRKAPEPIVPLKGEDAFWLTDLYPDATALFEHNHAPLDDVVVDCIVVLDANVLLLPFEFTKASVGEVERVYTQLAHGGRLVVPGQAAREYYKHRSRKIAAIADAIDTAIGKARKQIFEKQIPLLEDDEDYKAARELGAEVISKGEEVAKKLIAVNERLQNEIGDDRVSALYRKLLGACVADVEVTADERKSLTEEVARRARLQIAPGFKDQQKEDGGIGDYLVWRAILQEAQRRKTHCIFVTEEQKADWWIKRHGAFQPRPELIEEYRRASGGKSLHLLPLSALLATFKAPVSTISEVQLLEGERRDVSAREATADAEYIHLKLRKDYLRMLDHRRNIKRQLRLVEDRTRRVAERVNSEDPAAVSEDDWALLDSLQSERVALMVELAEHDRKYGSHAELENIRRHEFPDLFG